MGLLIGTRRALLGARGGLIQQIRSWQSSTLVHAGGQAQADWTGAASVNGTATGRTVISPSFALRQDALIRQVRVNVHARAGGTWKFKLFRYNSGTAQYDMVSEESFVPAATGAQTHTLTTPIAAQMADIPGIYLPTAAEGIKYSTAKTILSRLVSLDVTVSDAFVSTLATNPEVDVLVFRPYLACSGDSVFEGHNTASNWHGGLHDTNAVITNPGGEPSSEPGNQIRAAIGDGATLQYQNLALGSQTYAWVAATGIGECTDVQPHTVVILCGVNDVSTARAWAAVEADLDTIKAAFAASSSERLMICEILPWTAGTNANAVTIRTWNGSIAMWCSGNGATLIRTHDPMGQIRLATGELDDLLAAYDHDGVHLTTAGVDALAQIIAAAL